MGIEFRILGPLEVSADGRVLPLGSPKQRALLALLLVHANETLSRDRLIEELWAEAAPATVESALHSYLSRLRRLLEAAGAGNLLVREAHGYRLRVEPEQLDANRFERLVAKGGEALASGNAYGVRERLRQALALWRAPALADLQSERFAITAAARLEEQRLSALEQRLEADLALGGDRELIGELETLVGEHPYRERLRAQLMLALYRSGRQADALHVYREARETFVEELGIDPSANLQRLERAILSHDPALEAPAEGRTGGDAFGSRRELSDLPAGTVTFLFADIEGSTRLLHAIGARAYAEALAEYRRVVRTACARTGGVEVDVQGDGVFIAFATASAAVAAARELTERFAARMRVRVGLHTGTPLLTDEGYVGVDVHRAARIAGAAHGRQILLSESTRQLLDPAVAVRDMGEHRLKDLSAPQRLYQLGEADFPPLRTLYRTNLPIEATPLIGRDREREEAGALLRSHRLLTLTGPGGSGKTRLALEVAAEAAEHFPDGVYWVGLQALRDPALVERAIAASLGADDSLLEHVASRRLLVLLDNFEQVVEAAPTVSSLLSHTPNAKVLVTSREPLLVDSEQRYLVEPLPDDDAATLFVERARAVSPGFHPTSAVGEICRRLDGLPLAIELAAARVALLDPEELLARLDRRLPLLASRSRDAPARQRTLRAAIGWSYELLDRKEQDLFRRLAVFGGSFSLQAAEAVCRANLDTVESLLVKSLVRRWGSGRLGLLDTIHEYAEELLNESGEGTELRRHHAEYYLAVAESANLSIEALGRDAQRFELVIPDQHNLRAAIEWATDADIVLGLRLGVALASFWVTNDPSEGVRRFETLLERADDVEPILRARALRDYGGCADVAGDDEQAAFLYKRSGQLFREAGDEKGAATAFFRLGVIAMRSGEVERGRRLWDESLDTFRRLGDEIGELEVVGNLGWWELNHGDRERGREWSEKSLAMAREAGYLWWEIGVLGQLARSALAEGKTEEGEQRAQEALKLAHDIGDRPHMLAGLAMVAWAAAERGDADRAVKLWAAAEAEEAKKPIPRWRSVREYYAPHLPEAPPAGALELDDAVKFALHSSG